MHGAHRLQLGVALLELLDLHVDAVKHHQHLGTVLSAQAAQLEQLLGELAPAVDQASRDLRFDLQRRAQHRLFEHVAPLRQQLRAERLFESRQAAGLERLHVAGDSRCQRLACRQREHPGGRNLEQARGVANLHLNLFSHLLTREQRVDQRVDLVQNHKPSQGVGAQVVAPDRQIRLRDAGVCAQNEDRGVCRGQQAERQFRLGANRVQARRVEHHQALAQQWMRVVDQRMAPGRHLNAAQVIERRVVFGSLVAPEPELLRVFPAHPLGAHHFLQRCRQLLRVLHIERDVAPGARLGAKFGERQTLQAGFDGQQRQRGTLLPVPAQFHRAHRGAPRGGGQDAPASVGEEDRIDEFRFAARELGDEGDDELVAAQARTQQADLLLRGRVDQAVDREELCEFVQPLDERGAPATQGVETASERLGHE